MEAAVPKQLDALADFAAPRLPPAAATRRKRPSCSACIRRCGKKGVAHEEAFRGVLARVLVSPAFLFRIEQAPPGKEPRPVNDWELATRLSYFLWSSVPDDELRRARRRRPAARPEGARPSRRGGCSRTTALRALAIEFGTQWIHVRGFDELKEKNEKLFPTFDAKLRKAIYEESVLFFQDLFQSDRPVTQILDADYTFLNETLAKHYGIPGVTGPQWRRGRGRAEVRPRRHSGPGERAGQAVGRVADQPGPARQLGGGDAAGREAAAAAAERAATARGGRRQRRPDDAAAGREARAGRRRVPSATCASTRSASPWRSTTPSAGCATRTSAACRSTAQAKLKDGTEFEGIDGLRDYLLTKKKDVIVRLFCRKLLGYALGRAVALSDQPLIDEMVAELNKNDGRLSAAVLAIVRSPQFRIDPRRATSRATSNSPWTDHDHAITNPTPCPGAPSCAASA